MVLESEDLSQKAEKVSGPQKTMRGEKMVRRRLFTWTRSYCPQHVQKDTKQLLPNSFTYRIWFKVNEDLDGTAIGRQPAVKVCIGIAYDIFSVASGIVAVASGYDEERQPLVVNGVVEVLRV